MQNYFNKLIERLESDSCLFANNCGSPQEYAWLFLPAGDPVTARLLPQALQLREPRWQLGLRQQERELRPLRVR